MCNNYRLHVPANQLAAPFRDPGLTLSFNGRPAQSSANRLPHRRRCARPGAGVHWLNLSVPEDLILQACRAGTLAVRQVWPGAA